MGIKNYDTLMKYIKIGYDDADNMKSHYKQLADTYTDIKELQSWKGGQDYIKFCTEYKNLLDKICDVTNSYGTAMANVKTKLQAYDKLILLGWDIAIFQKVKKRKIDIPKKTDNVLFQAPLVELIQKRLKNNAAFFSDVYQRAIQVKKNLSQESMLAFNGSAIQKNLSAVSDELNRLAIKLAKIIEKYDKAETTAQKNAKDLNGWNTYITVNGKKYNCYDTHKEIYNVCRPPYVNITSEFGTLINISSPDAIKNEILNKYKKINQKNYNMWCGQYVYDKLKILGIFTNGCWNGKNWYKNIKNKKYDTTKLNAECIDGRYKNETDNCLYDLINAHKGENLYNVIISFGPDKGGKSGAGHVVLIDAIITDESGKTYVYFTESYSHGGLGVKQQQPAKLEASTFISQYNRDYNGIMGVAHFTKK